MASAQTFTVTNRGPDPAAEVKLTDTSRLPLRVRSIHPSHGGRQTGPPFTYTLGALGVGQHVTITATATGRQINAAAETSTSWHPDPAASIAPAHTLIHALPSPPPPPPFTG